MLHMGKAWSLSPTPQPRSFQHGRHEQSTLQPGLSNAPDPLQGSRANTRPFAPSGSHIQEWHSPPQEGHYVQEYCAVSRNQSLPGRDRFEASWRSSTVAVSHNGTTPGNSLVDLDLDNMSFLRSQLFGNDEEDVASGLQDHENGRKQIKVSNSNRSVHHEAAAERDRFSEEPSQSRHKRRRLNTSELVPQQQLSHPVKVHIQRHESSMSIEDVYPGSLPEGALWRGPRFSIPQYPETRQASLRCMKPCIVYTQFACEQKCRSRGICVHFSFILRGGSVPDGLICETCQVAGIERSHNAHRLCPMHNKDNLSPATPNLPEDFLATKEQRAKADEHFLRSLHCVWSGMDPKDACVGPDERRAETPDTVVNFIKDELF